MIEVPQNQLIADVARDVIAQTAPDELAIFQETSEASFKDPDGYLKHRAGRDETLGFGALEAISTFLASPIVLLLTQEAIKIVSAEVTTSDAPKKLFGKLFHRKPEKKAVSLPLSQQQLEQVARIVRAKALTQGLARQQADQFTDAIVARLALGTALEPLCLSCQYRYTLCASHSSSYLCKSSHV